jgi:MoaA/NifB/PqqE/SkfB family radical SAM enzyme
MATERKKSSFNSLNSKRVLESIFLFATGKCNAKCAMCFYAQDMDKKAADLSFDEIRRISETAGDFKRLWLSGGEPTMRKDLPEIIEMFCKNNHITDVNFPSNGILTDRVIEWLKRLRQSCPDANITISISFDGFAATHDRQRGVESFYQAAETLKKIDEEFKDDGKIIRNIGTVITKYNVDEVLDFMLWVYGRFNLNTHTIEAARGATREDGVKVLTEKSLVELQDKMAPFYIAYSKRLLNGVKGMARRIIPFFYIGLMRAMYSLRAANLEHPTPWNMDCTAGETTLVIDYDGRFRACELREPIGNVKDYNCDVQAIIHGEAMKKEIEAIGHGYKANCWCTHGCWMMSSITFNPGKMLSMLFKGNKETKKLAKSLPPLDASEEALSAIEKKYGLDEERLKKIGVKK